MDISIRFHFPLLVLFHPKLELELRSLTCSVEKICQFSGVPNDYRQMFFATSTSFQIPLLALFHLDRDLQLELDLRSSTYFNEDPEFSVYRTMINKFSPQAQQASKLLFLRFSALILIFISSLTSQSQQTPYKIQNTGANRTIIDKRSFQAEQHFQQDPAQPNFLLSPFSALVSILSRSSTSQARRTSSKLRNQSLSLRGTPHRRLSPRSSPHSENSPDPCCGMTENRKQKKNRTAPFSPTKTHRPI